MDKTKLFQSYEDSSDGISKNDIDLTARFRAAGVKHYYYGGTDIITGKPVVIIGSHGASLAEAAEQGIIVHLEKHHKPDERAQVIERALLGGLSEDDATRLATGDISYEDVDQSFDIPKKN